MDLLQYLESSKEKLLSHYAEHYANHAHSLNKYPNNPIQLVTQESPTRVNFTLRYKKKDNLLRNELEEYFKLLREDFEACDPLEWWVGRRAQFPNLYCLARDLISIPGRFVRFVYAAALISSRSPLGSAVAVERIFSGGRDTISLRRASLQPGTIRTLMLLKQRLRLARDGIDKVL